MNKLLNKSKYYINYKKIYRKKCQNMYNENIIWIIYYKKRGLNYEKDF